LAAAGAGGWELAAYTTWAALMVVQAFIDTTTGRLSHHLSAAATLTLTALLAPTGATTTC
jgi:hypothetical protein